MNLKMTTTEVEQWDGSQRACVDWMCRDMVNARTPKENLSAINDVNPNQEAVSGNRRHLCWNNSGAGNTFYRQQQKLNIRTWILSMDVTLLNISRGSLVQLLRSPVTVTAYTRCWQCWLALADRDEQFASRYATVPLKWLLYLGGGRDRRGG